MSNPRLDYNAAVRANLPSGITYSGSRYRFNLKPFVNFKNAKWYREYLNKTGGIFSPSTLFAGGEQGAWYDPSDLTTLFRGTGGLFNGAAAVTAPNQPVGFMLDKSKGPMGPNLIEGITESTSGWTRGYGSVNGTLVSSSGVLTHTFGADDIGSARWMYAITGLTVGRWYKLDIDGFSSSGVGDKVFVFTSSSAGLGGKEIFFAREETRFYQATATTMYLTLGFLNGTFESGSMIAFSGASLRSVPGNHAVQETAAAQPVYAVNPTTGMPNLLDDLVDDTLNATFPNLGTNATIAFADAAGVTILTGQTIGAGSFDVLRSQRIYGLIVLDRALTEPETASVTTYLEGKRA